MKKMLILLALVASVSVQAKEFVRRVHSYNNVAGTLGVIDYNPMTPSEYVVPLNNEADQMMQSLDRMECIKIQGSLNNDVIFAREITAC